jgi:hypothetical protein
MKHVSKNLWTSTLAAEFFSSDILRSFCFFGFAEELICSLCSMMLLLTLVMSKVDQAKTSLFLSRNDSSYTSSSDERSYATNTNFSGTIGYSMTRSVLHSTSIAVLPLLQASAFSVQVFCWPLSSAPLKKCTFLWLGAKPCSIFLTSF